MKKISLQRMVLLAILGAWALIMRSFDFPILPYAPFLKVDASDLVVLIGLLIAGPKGLIAVAGVRDGAHYLLTGGEGGIPIGIIMSFLASLLMFLPTHFVLTKGKRLAKGPSHLLMALGLVTSLTVGMGLFNYYLALPIYVRVMHFPIDHFLNYVMTLIVPFNLIKGSLIALGQWGVLSYLAPVIDRLVGIYPAYCPQDLPEANQLAHDRG